MKRQRPDPKKHKSTSSRTNLISLLLSDPAWGNGRPLWRKAPSRIDTQDRLARTVKRLRRLRTKYLGASRLAARLAQCATAEPCGSGACPVCLRCTQRWFVSAACEWIRSQQTEHSQVVTISWVTSAGRIPLGSLGPDAITAIKQECRSALVAVRGLQGAVFALDFSLNDDVAKDRGITWQVHLYGIAIVEAGTSPQEISQQLRAQLKAEPDVSRPVRVRRCDGTEYAVSYVFKTAFSRRTSYPYSAHGGITWNTRTLALKASHEVELLLSLDRLGISRRFLLHRVSPIRNGNAVRLETHPAS